MEAWVVVRPAMLEVEQLTATLPVMIRIPAAVAGPTEVQAARAGTPGVPICRLAVTQAPPFQPVQAEL